MFSVQPSYVQLPSDISSITENNGQPDEDSSRFLHIVGKSDNGKYSRLRFFLTLFTVFLAIWGAMGVLIRLVEAFRRIETASCNCGASTHEATTRGCKFDPISSAWLPDWCRDDELAQEFLQSGDGPDGSWLMWADPERSRALSLEEVALLADNPEEGRWYASHEWHVAHCMYNWKRQFRNRNGDVKMEKSLFTYHHIKHCEQVIRSSVPLNATSTISGVKLNSDDID